MEHGTSVATADKPLDTAETVMTEGKELARSDIAINGRDDTNLLVSITGCERCSQRFVDSLDGGNDDVILKSSCVCTLT